MGGKLDNIVKLIVSYGRLRSFVVPFLIFCSFLCCTNIKRDESRTQGGIVTLKSYDDEVYAPALLWNELSNIKGQSRECTASWTTRRACAIKVYEAAYNLYPKQFGTPFKLGHLITLIFNHELKGVVENYPKAKELIMEAYIRNLWRKICGGGEPGCDPKELLNFIQSKQGWYNKSLEDDDIHAKIIGEHDSELIRDYMDNKDEWKYQRNPNGVIEWANWDRNNPGFNDVKLAITGGHPLGTPKAVLNSIPFISHYCGGNYNYYFAIVTQAQDDQLDPGTGDISPCPKGEEEFKFYYFPERYYGQSSPSPVPLPKKENPPETAPASPPTASSDQPNETCPSPLEWMEGYKGYHKPDNCDKWRDGFYGCARDCNIEPNECRKISKEAGLHGCPQL